MLIRHFLAKRMFGHATGEKPSIGFIGLGNMGASMARNILKSKRLTVYDISAEQATNLVKDGANSAHSVAELAKQSDIIITMVPATKHVLELMQSEGGIFRNAKPGSLIIDCSTIDPITSKTLSLESQTHGLHMIDAPVSGGVTGAAAGTLTFMVGGAKEDLARAESVLSLMGQRIVHCGDPGAGGIAKLCNNLALAISMIGTSEALTLATSELLVIDAMFVYLTGKKLGIKEDVLAQVMNTSTARCWSSDSYNPAPGVMPGVPSSRGYTGGFASALMSKDLGLAVDAAQGVKALLPLGSSAHQLYGLMVQHGYAAKDFSAVYEFISKDDKSVQ